MQQLVSEICITILTITGTACIVAFAVAFAVAIVYMGYRMISEDF